MLAQPQNLDNIPQRGSPGVKFWERFLGDAFTYPDPHFIKKSTLILSALGRDKIFAQPQNSEIQH
jgi:hypothetical protein